MKIDKKKLFRRLLKGVGITIAVLLVLVLSAKLWLGSAIKSAINTFGPSVLCVPISVESASVDIIGGKVRVKNLQIDNPEGFNEDAQAKYLFKMDGLTLDISVADIIKGQVHILDLVIDGPHVWYIRQDVRGDNIGALIKLLEEKYPQGEQPATTEEPAQANAPQKPVLIDHLLVKEGTVGVKINAIGKKGIGGEVPLMEIELKDLGKEGALMPMQIVKILLKSISSSILSAIKGIGGFAVDVVEDVGSAAIGAVESVGGAAVKGATAVVNTFSAILGGSSDTNAPAEKQDGKAQENAK